MRTLATNPVVLPGNLVTARYAGAATLDIPVSKIMDLDAASNNASANSTLMVANAGPVPDRYELADTIATLEGLLNIGSGNNDLSFDPAAVGVDSLKKTVDIRLFFDRIIAVMAGPGAATAPGATFGTTFRTTNPLPNGNSVIFYDDGSLGGKVIHSSLSFSDLYARLREASYLHPDAAGYVETITAITQANPGVITLTNPYTGSVGDVVYFDSVTGMTELNAANGVGAYVVANIAGNDIDLEDLDGNPIDTTTFGAFAGAGNLNRSHLNDVTLGETVRLVTLKEARGVLPFGSPSSDLQMLINPGRVLREEPSVDYPGDTEIVYNDEGSVLVID